MRWGKIASFAGVLLLACGALSAQSTRGDIQGRVTDKNGAALPGVSATLESPALQGKHTTVTETEGAFKFLRLPPGIYTATFSLVGYQTHQQSNIKVGIDTTARFEVVMAEAFSSEIVVTSESPLVNTRETTVGAELSQDFFIDLPIDRNYTSVAAVTPGAQDDDSGQTFYGSTGAENAYYIDGVNTTDVEYGQQGTVLNFEFIEEVQVKAGGYTAEYGHATGGLINVITKSGGNEFHGDVFGYFDNDSLRSDLKGEAEEGAVWESTKTISVVRSDYGADLGGYFVRDKLWFFVAYDRVDNSDTNEVLEDYGDFVPHAPMAGEQLPDDTIRDLFAAKLTWRPGANHSLTASVFGDPSEENGAFGTLAAPPERYLHSELTGGTDGAINYDGVFGQSLVVSARYSVHNQKTQYEGPGRDLVGYADWSDPLGNGELTWGWDDKISGWGNYTDEDFGRQQYNADVSWFLSGSSGSHELKVGGEYEDLKVKETYTNSGPYGTRVARIPCFYAGSGRPCDGDYFFGHNFWVDHRFDIEQVTLDDVIPQNGIDTPSDTFAVYLQDRWQPIANLSLDVGVRWSRQRLYNSAGEVHAEIDDEWAPRLGFVWDFLGNGKSKLFGHWGYYYESIPMDIVIRAFTSLLGARTYNFSDDPADIVPLPDEESPSRSGIGPGGFARVDPNIQGQYMSEAVLGAEYEVAPNVSVSLNFIRRNLDRILEDAASPDHDWYIGNPGEGLMTHTSDIAYAYAYWYYLDIPCPDGTMDCHIKEIPSPKRQFTGVELALKKRFANNFQLIASALWSRLEGNYDGNFQASTGQLDPNLNSAYDYADFSVNNDGLLSNDRTWQLKFDGIYRFKFGLTTGLSAYYRSGVPITAMGYSAWYYNWEYYLSERGAFGRTDAEWEANLHLGYAIPLGSRLDLNLLLDVFNVLNRQGETGRYTQYTEAVPLIFLEEYQPVDWFTFEPLPPITPGEADRPPTDPAWNTPRAWQDPRMIRLGVRLSF